MMISPDKSTIGHRETVIKTVDVVKDIRQVVSKIIIVMTILRIAIREIRIIILKTENHADHVEIRMSDTYNDNIQKKTAIQ